MNTEIILIGGGGHCRSVIDVIEAENKYTIAGIIDNDKTRIGSYLFSYEIIGCEDDLPVLVSRYPNALVTIGQIRTPEIRIKLFTLLDSLGYTLPTIVSPRAYVSKYASVGRGSVVMHDVLINAQAQVGENCIINSKALIEHDCIVGNHCHISTGAVLNGETIVGDGTFVGSNSVSKQGTKIQGNAFIKAGSINK